jgi:N,N'-diacetyllegionaminate synthase
VKNEKTSISKTKIIAEVASNHGGDLNIAKEFIKISADIGVDYIKFQSWQAKSLSKRDPQYEWFVKTELSDEAHYELIEECNKYNIRFLTTCFSIDRIDFLAKLGIKEIKVGSPDCGSVKMIKILKEQFDHLIISTGMHSEEEIRKTAEILKGKDFTFLHCVSLYPTPIEMVNLRRIDWLRRFTSSVGYSDHCVGIEAIKIAIARGASYVEKHFTIENAPRRSPWDATPKEMREIVECRDMCTLILGKEEPEISQKERKARERFIGRFGDNK